MSDDANHEQREKISEPIKREVRQRCGFGCVVCGLAIIEYAHIEPYAVVREHDADNLTLLCPNHHTQFDKHMLPKDYILAKNAAPKCLDAGFHTLPLHAVPGQYPEFFLGTNKWTRSSQPLNVSGYPIITVESPAEAGGPYLISGKFFNSRGLLSAEIVRNEWFGRADEWDVLQEGNRITIRDAAGSISLRLQFRPGEGISVERLNMFVNGDRIEADEAGKVRVSSSSGFEFTLSGNTFDEVPGVATGYLGHISEQTFEHQQTPASIRQAPDFTPTNRILLHWKPPTV
ncbi:hypothetical protein GJ699_04540 [Duganella sp. FT80W]|uniref:HNH nuclease domain-containing protein n=1 Tax=Duganella guangzhouensis TaxID=2666084 RepID=A0A6I2KXU1_9BURK|nr:HNH endonuclease signature motif containing protein [Duganella guangzhouensis]MRW89244.1 hypothetical protein [Duganella guangzhouensis]